MPNIVEMHNKVPKSLFERAIETQAAIQAMQNIAPGNRATYQELKAAMGCDPQMGGRSNVNSARRYLQREHGMVFAAVSNVGYQRLTDAEIIKSSPEALTKSRRASRRAAVRLICVDFDKLSETHKVSHQVHLSLFAAIQALSKADAAKKLTAQVRETMRSLPLNSTLELFKK